MKRRNLLLIVLLLLVSVFALAACKAGEQGEIGDQGDKGATGDKGPQGSKGAEGDKGATGADGAKGSDATEPEFQVVDGVGVQWRLKGEEEWKTLITVEELIGYSSKYTLSYNTKGGEAISAETNVIYNEEIELPVAEREGYTFLGWYIDDPATLLEGETYQVKEDVTLNAKWASTVTLSGYALGEDIDLSTLEAGMEFTITNYNASDAGNNYDSISFGDAAHYSDIVVSKYWTRVYLKAVDYSKGLFKIVKYLENDDIPHWEGDYDYFLTAHHNTADDTLVAACAEAVGGLVQISGLGETNLGSLSFEDLTAEFIADFVKYAPNATEASKIDTGSIDSIQIVNFLTDEEMFSKWYALLDAIWTVSGSTEGKDPAVSTADDWGTRKGFYLENLCGFFTKTSHADSYLPTGASFDWSDETKIEAVLAALDACSFQAKVYTGLSKEDVVVNEGEKTTLPTKDAKDDKAFLGWTADGATLVNGEITPAGNVEYAPVYAYELNYELNGGELEGGYTASDVAFDCAMGTGWHFATSEQMGNSYMYAQDRVIISKVDEEYVVSDILAGGVALPESYEYRCVFMKDGSTYDTLPAGVQVGCKVVIDTEAKTAKFLAAGKEAVADLATAEAALPTPTQDGKVFAGWFYDEALTQECKVKPIKATTLYAKWLAPTTVTYKVNGGEWALESIAKASAVATRYISQEGNGYEISVGPTAKGSWWSQVILKATEQTGIYEVVEKATRSTLVTTATYDMAIYYHDACKDTAGKAVLDAVAVGQYITLTNVPAESASEQNIGIYVFDTLADASKATQDLVKVYVEESTVVEGPAKAGYKFVGWFDGETEVKNIAIGETATALELTAKWELEAVELSVEQIKYQFLKDVNASAIANKYITEAITADKFYETFSEKFMNVSAVGPYVTSGLMKDDPELFAKYSWLIEYIGAKMGNKKYGNTALVAFGLKSANDSNVVTGSLGYCDRTITNSIQNFLLGTNATVHGGSSSGAVPADFTGEDAYEGLTKLAQDNGLKLEITADDVINSLLADLKLAKAETFYETYKENFVGTTTEATGVFDDATLKAKYTWLLQWICAKATGNKRIKGVADRLGFEYEASSSTLDNYSLQMVANFVHNFVTKTGETVHGGNHDYYPAPSFADETAYNGLVEAAIAAKFVPTPALPVTYDNKLTITCFGLGSGDTTPDTNYFHTAAQPINLWLVDKATALASGDSYAYANKVGISYDAEKGCYVVKEVFGTVHINTCTADYVLFWNDSYENKAIADLLKVVDTEIHTNADFASATAGVVAFEIEFNAKTN